LGVIAFLLLLCSSPASDPAGRGGNFRSGPALLVDVVQAEGFSKVAAFSPETPHMVGECGLSDALTECSDGAT